MTRRLPLLMAVLVAVALLATAALAPPRPAPPAPQTATLEQELRQFHNAASVLMVAAHPDDEDTQLIAYLAHGRDVRTGYLSLTRGDGGQNVLGPVFGPALGVVRTHELLAAGAIDGAEQYFTRAIDFGFSKDYHEALAIWGHDQVLGDVVRVYRRFRPDVVITVFPFPPTAVTHGHHTASALLAQEAFSLAGDPKAYPEQLAQGLAVWQPKRLLYDGRGNAPEGIALDIGGADPVTGESFASIAGRSRAMHKTQNMGGAAGAPPSPHPIRLQVLAGTPGTQGLFDGFDPTWNRVPGGAAIDAASAALLAGFQPADPAASVPAVLALRRQLAALPPDPLVAFKAGQLDRILQHCLGLVAATTPGASFNVVPGQAITLHEAVSETAATPVRWLTVEYPGGRGVTVDRPAPASREEAVTLPGDIPVSQPYWLQTPGSAGLFQVEDPRLIGLPVNPPPYPVRDVFEIGGQRLEVEADPIVMLDGKPQGLVVRSPAPIAFSQPVTLLAPGGAATVNLEAQGAAPRLQAPPGWQVAAMAGGGFRNSARLTAPDRTENAALGAAVTVGGRDYNTALQTIAYPHLPLLTLQPPAQARAVSLDLAIRGRNILYLEGAGDDVAQALRAMGYQVKDALDTPPAATLGDYSAIVLGVRALNVRSDLATLMPELFQYAALGGTVVEQYANPQGLQTTQIAPYPLHLANLRTTDETAAMTVLAPGNPVLTTPNRIGPGDFTGWVQERGLYYADTWDSRFTPIFANHDPGEAPLPGSLLVAPVARGWWVYTGLSFFRQLPAGNPGAYRLFANLVSLGH